MYLSWFFVDIIERVFQLFKAHSVMKNLHNLLEIGPVDCFFFYIYIFFQLFKKSVSCRYERKRSLWISDQSLCICIAALCPCSFAFKLPIFFFFFLFFLNFWSQDSFTLKWQSSQRFYKTIRFISSKYL